MGRGAQEFDDLSGWLKHKPRSGGGNMLKGWKKKPGHIDTWMHTKRLPMAVYRHPFPVPTIVKDKTTGNPVKNIFSKKFTCHETEDVLGHPWRDKTTGEREQPPQRCGKCKFADFLWMNILEWVDTHKWEADAEDPKDGKWVEKKKGKGKGIDPCMRIFHFISDADAKQNVAITAGGYCGFLGQKPENLPTDVKKAMAKAKIVGTEVWKENTNPKCDYVMCIVDNDDVGKGLQVATETQALGEKVKEVITKTFKSLEQNIQKQPYCIRWDYDDSKEFSAKYDATAMMKIKPSARVLKLIRGEAPDLTEIKTPFNQKAMRAIYEKACLLPEGVINWDDIFPDDEQIEKWKEEDEAAAEAEREAAENGSDDDEEEEGDAEESDDDSDDDDDEDEEEEAPASAKKSSAKSKSKKDEDDDDDDQMVKCDNEECRKPMKLSATKCPHCGKKYDVTEDDDDEEEEEEEPAKVPTRAELAAQKKASDAKPKASAESAKKKSASTKSTKSKKKKDEEDDDDADDDDPSDDDDDDDQGDEIPF